MELQKVFTKSKIRFSAEGDSFKVLGEEIFKNVSMSFMKNSSHFLGLLVLMTTDSFVKQGHHLSQGITWINNTYYFQVHVWVCLFEVL